MFLHLSVSHSVHRGMSSTPPGQTPPGRHPWVDTLLGRHPLGRHPLSSACWDTPLLPSACWDTPPPAQCMLGYGQQVSSTHPTGMHTC